MAFPNKYPYTNFHELNLEYWIQKFNEIFTEWAAKMAELEAWQASTEEDLASWKTETLADLNDWETNTLAALDLWKAETGADISDWETGVISDLNTWKASFIAAYETLEARVTTIVSDTEDMVENLAVPFSTSDAYAAGDYVVYNGVLYKFTADHAAGAWNASEVIQTRAMDDYQYLDNQLANNKDILRDMIGEIPLEWESGGMYYATGIPYASNAAIRTTFIPVTAGGQIVLLNKLNAYVVVQEFADNTPSSAGVNEKIATVDAATGSFPKTITLNASCNYIRVSISQSDPYTGYDNIRIWQKSCVVYDNAKSYTDNAIAALNNVTSISNGTPYSNLISHVITPGLYYLTLGAGFTDRPEALGAVGTHMRVEKFAATGYVLQVITGADGTIFNRIVNTTTFTPSTADMPFEDAYGWFVYPYPYPIRYADKKIVVFGDSRVYLDGHNYPATAKSGIAGAPCIGFQQQLKRLNGMQVTSQGVSGDTSIDICTRIRAYDFTGFDSVLLDGGVNDFIKYAQITIGAIDDIGATFDTTTVYGAWQSAIEYIMTNYPGLKIYMTVPAIAWDGSDVMPYSIAEIKKNIAELYNLPIIDLYTLAGITEVNRDWFYADDVGQTGWRLHFNNDGNKWIGEMIARFVENN